MIEYIMSMNFISHDHRKKLKKIHKRQNTILKFTKIFAVLGFLFLAVSFAPSVWYSWAGRVDDFSAALLVTVSGKEEEVQSTPTVSLPDWQPVFDSRLPRDTMLKIPEIGVDTKVNETTYQNYEDALKLGVWRVPDFGTPTDRTKPMILAAHRFGYLAWTNMYRRKNSFYNLPKLEVGDTVEITYKQRKYIYEIYADSRGEEVVDYTANLILYTCETLNSSIRIFKYARLLKI